jgi:hypothetical protein
MVSKEGFVVTAFNRLLLTALTQTLSQRERGYECLHSHSMLKL